MGLSLQIYFVNKELSFFICPHEATKKHFESPGRSDFGTMQCARSGEKKSIHTPCTVGFIHINSIKSPVNPPPRIHIPKPLPSSSHSRHLHTIRSQRRGLHFERLALTFTSTPRSTFGARTTATTILDAALNISITTLTVAKPSECKVSRCSDEGND